MKIQTKEEYEAFLKVIERLMDGDPEPLSEQGVALEYLVQLVQEWENREI